MVFSEQKKNFLVVLQKRLDIFDQKWRSGLLSLLENAISNQRLLSPALVKHRLEEASWHTAVQYVDVHQVHYEFQYDGLLCIAQLKKEDEEIFELKDLWGLRYSSVPPEVICVDLGTTEHRNLLDDVANRIGEKAQDLAKRAILEKVYSIMKNLESQNQSLKLEIETLKEQRRQLNIEFYREVIGEFRDRLEKDYPETKGNKSWQSWIYSNNWLFGVQYAQPIERQRVGLASIPDFLFPTIDGFIDILEIKRPTHQVIYEDPSHPGSFTWSSETNKAIGQVVNYLHEIEINQLQLYRLINQKHSANLVTQVSFIKPRAFILIGRSNDWCDFQREALRKLNHSLHGIEVLTYDDLVLRGQNLIDLYVREIK
jgi:hypothetical protein